MRRQAGILSFVDAVGWTVVIIGVVGAIFLWSSAGIAIAFAIGLSAVSFGCILVGIASLGRTTMEGLAEVASEIRKAAEAPKT
ncbi:MAG: hypothetical protein AAGF30_00490 [Pseudomonadota bacterium]